MKSWQRELDEAAQRHSVPGAVLGLQKGSAEPRVFATGTVNARTGLPVQEQTLFQIGSLTKVWTAAMAMQFVDRGLLDLDAPIRTVIPEFQAAGGTGTEITMRHLITHSSGIECDLIVDTGRGDDVLELYLPHVAKEPLLHPVGEAWTYCNSGFMVAGRVLEVLGGKDWDQLLREMLIEPLGLDRAATLPEHVLLHSAALGHMHEPGQPFRPADEWHLPRVVGPAGSISATAEEVLAFSRMYLNDGIAADGTRVLSSESVAAMAVPQIAMSLPLATGLTSWGLGWGIFQWGETKVLAHTGGTIGQFAYVDMFPEHDATFVLLTNGGNADALVKELRSLIDPEEFGVHPPSDGPQGPAATEAPLGFYRRYGSSVELRAGSDGIEAVVHDGELDTGADARHQVLPVLLEDGRLVVRAGGGPSEILPLTLSTGQRAVMLGTRLLVEQSQERA